MKKNSVLSLILVLVLLVGVFGQLPITAAANATVRDTVLILDDSGSMEGEPVEQLIESAKKFCESVLSAAGTNRVAVITYSSYAELKCDFTDDMKTLEYSIEDMWALGTTNIYDAMSIANDLLSASNADVKNIVLMSDGLPNEGEMQVNGKYDYYDYYDCEYANAVYSQAVSYHPNYSIYTLGFFHNIYGDTKAFASRFMNDLQNAGYYEVDKVEDLEFTFGEIAEDILRTKVTGTFRYPSDGKDYSATYYYDDGYFYDPSTVYNQSLATMSLCLAMSAFGSSDVESYENKSVNVQKLMEEIQFTDFETTQTFKEKPTADSVAAAIGQKKVQDDEGDIYTLIAVAVRGGGYEQEWASNFTLGESGNHTGFSEAAQQVIAFISQYIADYEIEGNIKLWITGYSRAAATSNLVAGALDSGATLSDAVTLAHDDLYAYCFETPAGTTDGDSNDKSKYGNIFNIINPNDVVTKVAPSAMGFDRYGIDRVLPTRENKYKSYSAATEAMLEWYDALESTDDYVLDKFVYKKIDITHILPGGKDVVYESEQQISMHVFLEDFISEFVYGYINRLSYSRVVEDGIRELCKAIFQDESKAEAILNSTVDKIKDNRADLLWEFLWDEYGAYETMAGYLTDSLKEAGAPDFDDDEIKEAAQPLLDILISYMANNLDYLATLVDNGSYIMPAHYPDLCLAWMQSFDENYTTDAGEAFSSGSYRIIHINCPVDVEVYDMQGTLVASIVGDQAQQLGTGSVAAMINSDGEKVVYLPADAGFEINMTGTDSGTVNYSVNEYSYEAGRVNRIVNYYDIPVEKGRTLKAVVPEYDIAYLDNGTSNGTDTIYELFDMDGNILSPALDIVGDAAINAYHTVTVQSENTDHGIAMGSGVKRTGAFAQAVAVAAEGYVFDGWYLDGQKVSSDQAYRFKVTEDVTLTAKFVSDMPAADENISDKPVTDDNESNTPKNDSDTSKSDNCLWIIIIVVVVLLVLAAVIALFILLGGKKQPVENNDYLGVPVIPDVKDEVVEVKENRKAVEEVRFDGEISITSGSMNGFTVPIKDGETLYLGKDATVSNIVFTKDYPNVSRMHCSVTFDAKTNKYYVIDSSSNGTYLANRQRLIKGKRTPVGKNTVLLLANDECTVWLK